MKLINSLSWAPDIVVPKAIDPAKTIFRLDIGDIDYWSDATWDRILSENPYGVTYSTASATACYQQCKTQQPFVRGDWFVARASIPPLYHDILDRAYGSNHGRGVRATVWVTNAVTTASYHPD